MNDPILECPDCGMVIERAAEASCPKCDAPLMRQCVDELHVIDVAHSGEDWYMAEQKIERGVDYVRLHQLKGLKVIHGYGSGTGHTSYIRDRAIQALNRLARTHSGRLTQDRHTPGAHILYFNRG